MADTSAMTLREALEHTYRTRWAGTRSEKCLMSQATLAADHVAWYILNLRGFKAIGMVRLDHVTVEEVHPVAIRAITASWYAQGLAPATINKRLGCLSAMGVKVEGCKVKVPKVLKWWLRPEDEAKVVEWLATQQTFGQMAFLIQWTTRTGLRIEETLRLTRRNFNETFTEVQVPGTKTSASEATLALGSEASALVRARLKGKHISWPLVGMTYDGAQASWERIRAAHGWKDQPTATLKSLRRSAARYLHYDRGMPLDMVRQYLRHEDIETTMGYLRLTGGVSLDEQRRYLG